MKIRELLDALSLADEHAHICCVVSVVDLRSRIYAVGQVAENIPGLVLGQREPFLREKTVGILRNEL